MQIDLIENGLFEAPLLELFDMLRAKVRDTDRLDPAPFLRFDTGFPA